MNHWTRRQFITTGIAGSALTAAGYSIWKSLENDKYDATTAVLRCPSYDGDLRGKILEGLKLIGWDADKVREKKVLLKPNYVEILAGAWHINTHPKFVRAVAEAFLQLGAAKVIVAEGSGHSRDTLLTLDATGLGELLAEDKIPFVDLNTQTGVTVKNAGGKSKLQTLTFPSIFREVDFIVSLPKMKTHHWAGVTLSMKNLFGVMPGNYYGWPKNVLHFAGLQESILDINATLPTHLAIVDGITGMEGDGPIMGDPVASGLIVFGESFPSVDATAARLMKIDPLKVPYLKVADGWLGSIQEEKIRQLGEEINHLAHPFKLIDSIAAQKNLRLS